MKTSIIAVAIAALTSFVSAAPAVEAAGLAKRGTTHFFVCTNEKWGGECENLTVTTGKCTNLSSKFLKKISSLGPDAGTSCTMFENLNCDQASEKIYVNYPGHDKLSGHQWDNRGSSYICTN
ncbi:hypothetical protein B0H66DRAFT_148922 [Apodospora peruviana]|uniref:Uncharacterized protein n=1 Tax=Apodospora peruviana TaxID=516989 RepID=A0AAE0IJS2_9PEZI|nr:hypothetical protein B0H66DRAFT_148922 [Apodospora peruviana]